MNAAFELFHTVDPVFDADSAISTDSVQLFEDGFLEGGFLLIYSLFSLLVFSQEYNRTMDTSVAEKLSIVDSRSNDTR